MKNYFTIGEAAAEANMTTETLRHYDRVGLVKPSRKDEWTNYRYYTKQDIVRLMTVRSLQQMDLPLKKIKQVLEYDSLEKIIAFLETAEKKADEKIALLQDGKAKIRLAIADYERILLGRKSKESAFVEHMPQRVILLSDTMETPSVDVLWNYLSHFNDKIPSDLKKYFSFEDLAGIYTENGMSRLFAVCRSYADTEDLKVLPEGDYLCIDCSEENRDETINQLIRTAKEKYSAVPDFMIQMIVVSGILQWKYQIQIPIATI